MVFLTLNPKTSRKILSGSPLSAWWLAGFLASKGKGGERHLGQSTPVHLMVRNREGEVTTEKDQITKPTCTRIFKAICPENGILPVSHLTVSQNIIPASHWLARGLAMAGGIGNLKELLCILCGITKFCLTLLQPDSLSKTSFASTK